MTRTEDQHRVVVVGASAGGLQPLRSLVAGLTTGNPHAVLVAQHLSPNHGSVLVELLDRVAGVPVEVAQDGLPPRPGAVTVVPPNRHAELRDGAVVLREPSDEGGPVPSVTRLLRSAAEDLGPRVVGVVLSGAGTDGAVGMLAVRAAGGLTVVQDLGEVEYPGMPHSAIDVGAADRVLDVQGIVDFLAGLGPSTSTAIDSAAESMGALRRATLRETGVDLDRYRSAVVQRRVARRVAVTRSPSLAEYVARCRRDPDELRELVADLYINVTEFFRDPDRFDALREAIAGQQVEVDDVYRVWSAGCATGEEAYSLSILLDDLQRSRTIGRGFQIFATDVSGHAIAIARRAQYPVDAIRDLPARTQEHFVGSGDRVTVVSAIRNRVVFSVSDLGEDPPFSRMHLAVCRNLLVYLDHDAQAKALTALHYSLAPGGLLFLGPAETTGAAPELFEAVDAGIFRAVGPKRPLAIRRRDDRLFAAVAPRTARSHRGDDVELHALRGLAAAQVSATLVVSGADVLVWTRGDTGRWLRVVPGEASLSLGSVVDPVLRAPLLAAVHHHRRRLAEDEAAGPHRTRVPLVGGTGVAVTVDRLDARRPGWVRVDLVEGRFTDPVGIEPADEEEARIFRELGRELDATRSSLHLTVSELERATYELQTTNEELQTTNEEFQSTNEELQSTNEELVTVNAELTATTAELRDRSRQLDALLEASPSPILLLDDELRVIVASRSLEEVAGRAVEAGTPLSDVVRWTGLVEVGRAAEVVLAGGPPTRGRVQVGHRTWTFAVAGATGHRDSPVTATFTDVTDLEAVEQQADRSDRAVGQILSSVRWAVVRWEQAEAEPYLNDAARRLVPAGAGGAPDLAARRFRRPDGGLVSLEQLRDDVLATGQPSQLELQDVGDDGEPGAAWLLATCLPLHDRGGADGVLLSLTDHSEQRSATSELRWAAEHDALTGLLNRRAFERVLRDRYASVVAGVPSVVLFVDVDGLKQVNDVLGHGAGDDLVRGVADVVRDHIRADDAVARIGGDEFAVLLAGMDTDGALIRAEQMRGGVAALRLATGGDVLSPSVSIGLAPMTADDPSGERALARADTAVLAAKGAGKNRIEAAGATADAHERRLDSARLGHLLRSSDDGMGLFAEYEPMAPLGGAPVVRVEQLVRLRDGDEVIAPTRFILSAERSGAVIAIDAWSLEAALRVVREVRGRAVGPFRVHVNVSRMSLLDDGYRARATELLAGCGADAIALELTETAAHHELPAVAGALRDLRDLGVEVFLDDFGRGFNTLDHLANLPLDGLKLDDGLLPDPATGEAEPLLRHLAGLAVELGLTTVAEHVGDEATASLLRSLQVDYAQGELVGRGLSRAEVVALLSGG